MSSHHIIREDQEPALILDDARSENFDTVQQLLEWSPTVIVTERALPQILLWGIKIDVVIGDCSRIEILSLQLQDQFPLKILASKNEADLLPAALNFLIAANQKTVNIITDLALEPFEKFPALDVAVIHAGKRWVFIRNGHFEKWLPKGSQLSIYPESVHPVPQVENDGMVTLNRDHSFWICEIS